MTVLGWLPAPGVTLDRLDERAQLDVDAYREAFGEVVDLNTDVRAARRCTIARTGLDGAMQAMWLRSRFGLPYALSLAYDPSAVASVLGHRVHAAGWKAVRLAACAGAAGLLVSSEGLVKRWRLRERFAGKPLAVVPNGVDLSLFVPGRPSQPPRVAFVGRLERVKNLIALVEAVATLPGVVLDLIGDGPERYALATRAREVGVTAFFAGQLPYSEVARRLRWASAFCLPSLTEGSPKALWEAMATGLPCVVSDRVPDTHLPAVRCQTSAASIASALRMALSRPVPDTAAWRWAEQHRDWTKTIAAEIAFVKGVGDGLSG